MTQEVYDTMYDMQTRVHCDNFRNLVYLLFSSGVIIVFLLNSQVYNIFTGGMSYVDENIIVVLLSIMILFFICRLCILEYSLFCVGNTYLFKLMYNDCPIYTLVPSYTVQTGLYKWGVCFIKEDGAAVFSEGRLDNIKLIVSWDEVDYMCCKDNLFLVYACDDIFMVEGKGNKEVSKLYYRWLFDFKKKHFFSLSSLR